MQARLRLSLVFFLWYLQVYFGKISGQNGQCGGELNPKEYILVSPGYPTARNRESRYPSNLDCEWYVIGDGDMTAFSFKFWDLVVEIGDNGSNETCEYDYVNVSITSIGSRRYCGYKPPTKVIVGVGSLHVIFHSDNSRNFRGFQATYQIFPDFDPCEKNPCKNGDCSRTPDKLRAMCECFPGFSGITCETNIDECESDPCLNGGICDQNDRANHYSCKCPAQWEGERCQEEKSPPCLKNPCLNEGKCQELKNFEYECDCASGYGGKNCELLTGCGNPGVPYLSAKRRFSEKTTLNFSCKRGHNLTGAVNLTCFEGNWTSEIPQCVATTNKPPPLWRLVVIGLSAATAMMAVAFILWIMYRWPWANYLPQQSRVNDVTNQVSVVNSINGSVNDDVFVDDIDDFETRYSPQSFY